MYQSPNLRVRWSVKPWTIEQGAKSKFTLRLFLFCFFVCAVVVTTCGFVQRNILVLPYSSSSPCVGSRDVLSTLSFRIMIAFSPHSLGNLSNFSFLPGAQSEKHSYDNHLASLQQIQVFTQSPFSICQLSKMAVLSGLSVEWRLHSCPYQSAVRPSQVPDGCDIVCVCACVFLDNLHWKDTRSGLLFAPSG